MTSAIFQSDGKVEVPSEQLIISVIGPSITCRASLNTLALVLSGPGALFNGKDKMTRHINVWEAINLFQLYTIEDIFSLGWIVLM